MTLLKRIWLVAGIGVACLVIASCSGSDGDGADAARADGAASATPSPSPSPIPPSAPESPPPPADDVPAPESPPPPATDAPAEPAAAAQEVTPVVFADDFGTSIAPILTTKCASCHNSGGPGASHWRLETAGDALETSQQLASVVTSGYMPPWPASDDGVAFKNYRGLRQDERDAIIAWAAAGGQIDVAPTAAVASPAGPPALRRVDAVLTPPEPYQGSPAQTDDYRCLTYDPQLDSPAWITGYNFVPDQTEVVHHAVGYLVPREAAPSASRRDAEDDGAGYACFGGVGLSGADDGIFLAWAPGQDPTEFPEGAGLPIEPGDVLVIQIHYHYETAAPADLSGLELSYHPDTDGPLDEITIADYLAPAEIPCSTGESGPLCDRDAAMANAIAKYGPGGVLSDEALQFCGYEVEDFAELTNGIATASCELPVYEFGEIVSVLGHEHELGATFRMTLNPGRPDERVLLDIPTWDFNWQYNYEPVEEILVEPGDSVEIECSWDRSLRDPSLEPAYILWADGTDDEMCFATIVTRSLS